MKLLDKSVVVDLRIVNEEDSSVEAPCFIVTLLDNSWKLVFLMVKDELRATVALF